MLSSLLAIALLLDHNKRRKKEKKEEQTNRITLFNPKKITPMVFIKTTYATEIVLSHTFSQQQHTS